jgi:uncharacterized membrane protein (UPF0127 family)
VIASNVEMADSLFRKVTGVMFRRHLPPDFAMIFDMDREMRADIAIHMVFVFVSIDVIYLDGARRIVDIKRRLRPWIGLAIPKRPARYAIEVPGGAAEAHGLREGEGLEW